MLFLTLSSLMLHHKWLDTVPFAIPSLYFIQDSLAMVTNSLWNRDSMEILSSCVFLISLSFWMLTAPSFWTNLFFFFFFNATDAHPSYFPIRYYMAGPSFLFLFFQGLFSLALSAAWRLHCNHGLRCYQNTNESQTYNYIQVSS